MKKYLRHLGPVIISAIFCGAIFLLYHKLKAYSLDQIHNSITQISHWRLLASVLLMLVNYAILVGYDWLALVAIHKPLPLRRVALVSFIGQTVSYNFGALLGGTTVRYRFYATWDFSLHDIVRLVLMLAVTFWVGALGLCGVVFLINPPDIPAEIFAASPIQDVRILGAILLSITLIYFVACYFIRKPITIFGKEFVFPTLRIALLQAFVAGVDLIVAAGCMYVLFSSDMGISFGQFLPSYLMAQVAVVLTHVPGGVGVFELVILHLTNTSYEQMVVAVVLCFRIIYFILPLLMAAMLLAVYEVRHSKGFLRDAGRWLSVLSHSINARVVAGVGSLLLVLTALPVWQKGHLFLAIHWNSWVALGLHWLCALSGVALLFVSYGLEIRQAKAWRIAMVFLGVGVVAAVLKGIHLFVALMIVLAIFSLFSARKRFYRKSFCGDSPYPFSWLIPFWLVLAACLVLDILLAEGHGYWWSQGQQVDAMSSFYSLLSVYALLGLVWLRRQYCRRKDAQLGKIAVKPWGDGEDAQKSPDDD